MMHFHRVNRCTAISRLVSYSVLCVIRILINIDVSSSILAVYTSRTAILELLQLSVYSLERFVFLLFSILLYFSWRFIYILRHRYKRFLYVWFHILCFYFMDMRFFYRYAEFMYENNDEICDLLIASWCSRCIRFRNVGFSL